MFKVIVAGGRGFNNYDLLKTKLDLFLKNKKGVTIVSGTCRGADKLGEKYAKESNLAIIEVPAEWQEFGKKAGFIRNEKMAQQSDALIAFWNGKSRGTKNMIELAKKYNLKIRIVYYES